MNVNAGVGGKFFIDTNVWVYLYSEDQPAKQAQVKKLIEHAPLIMISTQVLNELVNVFMKKHKLHITLIEKILQEILVVVDVKFVDISTIQSALHICMATKYSYYDSLMLASALACNCSFFYSEDMKSGHVLDGRLTIINPFKL